MRSQALSRMALLLTILGAAEGSLAQEAPTPPPPEAEPAETKAASQGARFLPLEGNVIINLPSVDVPREGTLSVIFTHRFRQAVQNSDAFHDLLSFDTSASIGIGLGYTPLPNLDLSFYRTSESQLDPWEMAAKYQFLSGPVGLALRLGADIRSERDLTDRTTYFAQGILAFTLGDRARITAVPTYASKVSGAPRNYFPSGDPPTPPPPHDRSCEPGNFSILCTGLYRDVFSVPVGVSVALTRTITVHGEVTARMGRYDSSGVGWIATIEKSVLRHRFCFTAGNQRQTTVDQYATGLPYASRFSSDDVNGVKGIYLGFNLARQWKVK